MKIQRDVTVFAGQEDSAQQRKTIYAGDLNTSKNLNPMEKQIEQKRKEAQKKALKVVEDAWDIDRTIEDDLEARRNHLAELKQDRSAVQSELNQIQQEKEKLKETYQVNEDGVAAGGEDMQTEYQSRLEELTGRIEGKKFLLDGNQKEVVLENATIRGIRQERLKSNPMGKAQEQADDIMDAAGDEIVGMIMEETKDHIDEEQEKREEQAEKIKEEKEQEEEEQQEKEQNAIVGDMPTDEILSLNQTKTDVRQEVQNIVDKMKLVAEDIKGAMVDESI